MKKNNIVNRICTIGLITLVLSSCQKSAPVGNTSAVKVANDWWCHLLDEQGNALTGYAPFSTYNTSGNKDSIWVDDGGNLYNFKVKAKFTSDGTFESSGTKDEYYDPSDPTAAPETVKISDGKVLEKAGKSKTGAIVDSIYMKVIFSDDPSTTYIIAGTAKTGFDEDDY